MCLENRPTPGGEIDKPQNESLNVTIIVPPAERFERNVEYTVTLILTESLYEAQEQVVLQPDRDIERIVTT